MLCKRCNKQEAKIHFAKIINNQTTEFHLCEACAQQMNIMGENHEFHLENLITGLQDQPEGAAVETTGLACPVCGQTSGTFKRTGRLGCPRCYTTFHDELIPLLRKIHGSAHHTGKSPARAKPAAASVRARDIKRLRRDLREAISQEDYERAAEIRDEIKRIEVELKTEEGANRS
ncbi:UvrB/UvrC motif-containing protein [bacterium]|nr:UvrB/UvrC motif-containing protein [bacterium]